MNKNLSLSEGRKIAAEYAVADPTLNDIEKALKRLNLKFDLEKDAKYPGKWYEKSGRALVEWEGTKRDLIKEISLKIKETKK